MSNQDRYNLAAARIKSCRLKAGMTQEQIGDICGVKKSTVGRWENGKIKNIALPTIQLLANLFKVTPAWLSGLEDAHEEVSAPSLGPAPIITDSTVTFPVLGDLAAGYDNIALEDWRGDTVEIPVSYLNGRERDEFIVLCVKGDSMYPNYQPGDRVLILRQEDVPESGTVGAVRYDDECATLKIVEKRTTPEGDLYIRLKPINPQYPPFDIRGEALAHFSVIGVPKLLIRDIEE